MNSSQPNVLQQLADQYLTVEQSRRVDQIAIDEYGMNSLVLMENAGLGCVRWLESNRATIAAKLERSVPPSATILCGSGNNCGDGLVIARHLELLGWSCHAVVLGPIERLSSDARANFEIVKRSSPGCVRVWEASADEPEQLKEELRELERQLAESTIVVDAMLGTGSQGAPRSPLDDWIRLSNASAAYRVAVDLPTGLDAESGEAEGDFFHADATLTFVAKKIGMRSQLGSKHFGRVEVVPIGVPIAVLCKVQDFP